MEQQVNAGLLAKWISVLFWLNIISIVTGLFTSEGVTERAAALAMFANLANAAVQAGYSAVLIKIVSEDRNYRKSGICMITGVAISLISMLIPDEGGNLAGMAGTLALSLLMLALNLASEYYEFGAHANVLDGIDTVMSEKWRRLWRWTLGTMLGMIVGLLGTFFVPFLGLLIVLIVTVGLIIIGIMRTLYLYQTAKAFRLSATAKM